MPEPTRKAKKKRRKKKSVMSAIKAAKAAQASKADPEKQQSKVALRWTSALVDDGWTVVSDFFLANYRRLVPPLTNTEAMLVVHLLRFKWDERPPRPAYKTLARCMGLTDTAVRGHARNLEAKGCLQRRKRVGAPNWFYLEPLFEKLEALMPEVAAEEAARKAEQAEAEKWPGTQ